MLFNFSVPVQSFSEVEQSLAGLISDRATDEVLESLTRYKRGMGIPDSPNTTLNDSLPPDIVRSRSSHVSSITFLFEATSRLRIAVCFLGFNWRSSSCGSLATWNRITNGELLRRPVQVFRQMTFMV